MPYLYLDQDAGYELVPSVVFCSECDTRYWYSEIEHITICPFCGANWEE
jgi:hypothetical protein